MKEWFELLTDRPAEEIAQLLAGHPMAAKKALGRDIVAFYHGSATAAESVVAEIVATTDGIGAMMMRAKRFVHVDDIMAGIVIIGALGLLFDGLFRALHWRAFPYLRQAGD